MFICDITSKHRKCTSAKNRYRDINGCSNSLLILVTKRVLAPTQMFER